MWIKRQRIFSNSEEEQREYAVNPVKNLVRKAGRDIKHLKTQVKVAAGKSLNNKEVGMLAADQKVMAQRMKNGKMGVINRKAIELQGGQGRLEEAAKGLRNKYVKGSGATNLGSGLLL